MSAKVCVSCLTRWTATPKECPECGSPSIAGSIQDETITLIRRTERKRIADLFDQHALTIGEFVGEGERAVRLISLMLSFDIGEGDS